MPIYSALIVDDEPDILELLALTLSRMDVEVSAAENLTDARKWLKQKSFNLCLTDMRLPDGDGVELVQYIQLHYPETPVAMITAHGNMETAINALKAGAYDFVSKPVDLKVLRDLVTSALKVSDEEKPTTSSPLELLGNSPVMDKLRKMIGKLARSQAPVYISGESGSGKELVARLIHEYGPRKESPFVPVNCGAIPSELMESEFFGHKKGSFTGASTDKIGLFQAADGGTLFLDEVADLPLPMQVKLLRAIQEKAVRPVGAQKEVSVDVRLLSATHKNLVSLVAQGGFRQDLYYRVNVIQLNVPSLREREDDILLLARHLLASLNNAFGGGGNEAPQLSKNAVAALMDYSFPGNVRELENILERAMTLCEGNIIHEEDLQLPQIRQNSSPEEGDRSELDPYLNSIERDVLVKALEQARFNKTAAARKLGITLNTLRYRMRKLGVE